MLRRIAVIFGFVCLVAVVGLVGAGIYYSVTDRPLPVDLPPLAQALIVGGLVVVSIVALALGRRGPSRRHEVAQAKAELERRGRLPGDLVRIGTATMVLLVLLRLAIGWHLLYEGLWKLDTQDSDQPWTSEGYLRNATGPLGDYFRELAVDPEDPEGLRALSEQAVEAEAAEMDRYAEAFGAQYELSEEQQRNLTTLLDESKAALRAWYEQPLTRERIEWVRETLSDDDALRAAAAGAEIPAGLGENPVAHRQGRDEVRRAREARQELVAELKSFAPQFREAAGGILTDEQREHEPPAIEAEEPERRVEKIDRATMIGLTVFGGLMIVGLFARLACLGGGLMLLMFYIASPPFPGLPGTVVGPSHYLYVNTQLIEAIALLALATTRSGRWAGLDALVHAIFVRPLRRRR